MADIFSTSGRKLATMDESGEFEVCASGSGSLLGRISEASYVYNAHGETVGSVGSNGYIYKGSSHIGTVQSDGDVYDSKNTRVGKVTGGHIEAAGAALLLLVMN